MIQLGNFSIKEIIHGIAQDYDGRILYYIDQLNKAGITINSEKTEVKDKAGNVVRAVYKAKTGELSATSALLSPALLNAQSGSEIEYATAEKALEMPYMVMVVAGASVDASTAKEGTIHVIGIYNDGANGKTLEQGTSAVVDKTFAFDSATKKITLPAAEDGAPTKYLVWYKRDNKTGMALSNYSNVFPSAVRLTLQCAVSTLCDSEYKAAYLFIPAFQPDPSVTINLDADSTECEFKGTMMADYCTSENKLLYTLYFPDEDVVTTAVGA